MKILSKLLIISSGVFVVLWLMPNVYNFATIEPSHSTFTLYSTTLQDFVSVSNDDKLGVIGITSSGDTLSEAQTDSALPLFYARQLQLSGTAPDSIEGVPFDFQKIQRTNFIFRTSARDLNTPLPKLYFLLESMPKRGELQMPSDVFRFTDNSMEFIDMHSNQIDVQKSEEFSSVLASKGFSFPARDLNGITSVRKEYDEGYLMVDNNGALFHIKQTVTMPYCRKIETPADIQIKKVFITEFSDRRTLGYVIDSNNQLYVVLRDGYRVVRSGISDFDPFSDNILIIGNMFDWTVRISRDDSQSIYAISNSDFSLITEQSHSVPSHGIDVLSFSSPRDSYIYPRLF